MLAQHLERGEKMLVGLRLEEVGPRAGLEYVAHDLLGFIGR